MYFSIKKHCSLSLAFALLLLGPAAGLRAEEETTDDLVVEKNLFHNERRKWLIDANKLPEQKLIPMPKDIKDELDKISLYGTVVSDDKRYAILRTKKKGFRGKKEPYMVGDFFGGFKIAAIEAKRVILSHEGSKDNFEIFINEGSKDRSAVKTEIRERGPSSIRPAKPGDKKIRKKKGGKKTDKSKNRTKTVLKKNMKKHIKILKTKDSKAVKTQAQRDYRKLKRLLPFMDDKEREEVLGLKNELDSVLKK